MPPADTPQEKQGWDTRAWLVGILGGVVGGSITAWADYPPFARRVNTAVHSAGAADWISGGAAFLSLLVLPAVISGIARRWTFLWGVLPFALSLAAIEVEDWVENGPGHVKQFWGLLLALCCCLLVSSGPVSLFRSMHARTRRRREAAHAALAAQREAASIPQEGVWPPPPDYRR